MKSKVGAVAALVQVLTLLSVLVFGFVIEPGQGITSPVDYANPAKVQAYATQAPAVYFLDNFTGVVLAATLLILAMFMYERLRDKSSLWSRVAANSAVISATLFLAQGIAGILSPALFASIGFPLAMAAIFAYGWWVFLTSWVAMKGGLPQPLNYLGLVWGGLGVIGFLIPALAYISPVLGVIWAGWLGITLWSEK